LEEKEEKGGKEGGVDGSVMMEEDWS